jgi:hypothetical protein
LYWDLLRASITVQTSIDNGATWTNNTGSFTSPRCDIPTPTVTTRFRMQSVNAPLVYSNEIEFIPQLRPQLAVMV